MDKKLMEWWKRIPWKNIGMKLLFPKTIWIFLLVNASAIALVYIFGQGMEEHPIAYVVYVASAYALTIVCARIPAVSKEVKGKLHENKYTNRYLTDYEFRLNLSIYRGLVINTAFAVFKVIMGILYSSGWLFAMAGYHMLLSLLRFILVHRERKEQEIEDSIEKRKRYVRTYRICGGLLFVLDIAISVIVGYVVVRNQEITYPGYMIFAMAGFSFYCLTMAIINMVKYYRLVNPLYSAIKRIELTKALVSLFTMQVAMLTQFGNGGLSLNQTFNAMTGLCVCIVTTIIAIDMFRKKNKQNYLGGVNNE